MGRKSVADIRRREILDAYETCVRTYGFHQSSMRKIAELAGVKQPVISHYFGNKAAMVQALVERVEDYYLSQLSEALGDSKGELRMEKALDWLFGPEFLGERTKERPLGELLAAARRDEGLRVKIIGMYSRFLAVCETELKQAFPSATEYKCKQVAYGVLSMGSGNDLMVSTGLDLANRNLARHCAEELIRGLQA